MTTGFAGEFIPGSSYKKRCQSCALNYFLFIPFMNSIITVAMMLLDRAAFATSIVVSISFGLLLDLHRALLDTPNHHMVCITLYDNSSLLVLCLLMVIFAGTLVLS